MSQDETTKQAEDKGTGLLDALEQGIASDARQLLNADQSFLLLQNPAGELEIVAESSGEDIGYADVSRSVCNLALKGGPILIADATTNDLLKTEGPSKYRRLYKYTPSESIKIMRLKSVVAVPLVPRNGQTPYGLLYVCSYNPDHLFADDDLAALNSFTDQRCLVIDLLIAENEGQELARKAAFLVEDRGQLVDRAVGENLDRINQTDETLNQAVETVEKILWRAELSGADMHNVRVTAAQLRQIIEHIGEAQKNTREISAELDAIDTYWQVGRTMAAGPEITGPEEWLQIRERLQMTFPLSQLSIVDELPVLPLLSAPLFEEILLQLIKNSVQAGSTAVTVKARKHHTSYLVISLQDNGSGVPSSSIDSLTEWRFPQDDKAEDGRGLGLYIVNQIVDYADGQLHIEALETGIGMRLSVLLPGIRHS